MDTVYIKGLKPSTTIGVYEHERNIKQTLVIDLFLGCDTRAAGHSDDFHDALDYDAVSRRTHEFVEASRYFLIESVAEKLADLILAEFPVLEVKVCISKPGAVDICDDVGVIIERTKS